MSEGSAWHQGFETDEPTDVTRDRWLQAQRDLITTTLDYNLQTIRDLVKDGRIDLSPSFQRRERWDDTRRSRLIESFLMNVPLPPVFLNEDEYGQYSIIDGKQRMTAVSEFLGDGFPLRGLTVFIEANGMRFSQLDPSLQSVLQTRASLRAIILLRLSDPLIKYHVFQRLNTGGVRLNAQEVRNVSFSGALNDRLIELSSLPEFRALLGIDSDKPEKSSLWREMRDVELVLRYLTLRENWEDFSGSLGGAMNEFMTKHDSPSKVQLAKLSKDFTDSVLRVDAAFGTSGFNRWSARTGTFGKQPLATLFDAQMLAVADLNPEGLQQKQPQLVAGMIELFQDESFTRTIGSQTNTPSFVKRRIETVSKMVQDVLDD